MNTNTTSLCIALCLALGASTPALADRGEQRGYYYQPAQHRDYHHGGSRGYGWVAPAAVLAITGLAVGLAASTYYAPPPVQVVTPQPVYVPPPTAYWNYCGSAGQYYPNVRYCPEGWQLVPAR
ncbi:hypothetical protein [Accumulibacter sp.]|uniref:hypothetical protein n=1 Tax=Accumulibacter sp. TaxID=2053492 RepID=UPI002C418870|nr:hypothetical protein [Accumulibacter sp.]HPU81534.1 hypothetical protein [Accumulibacter sp.]